jgi:hypothetical protein
MRHRIARVLLVLTVMTVGEALAAKGHALVIGNAAYEHESVLVNTLNDAEAMARRLRALDFEVTLEKNLNTVDQRKAINRFDVVKRKRTPR